MSVEARLQDNLIAFLRKKLQEERQEKELVKMKASEVQDQNNRLMSQVMAYDLFLHELESDLLKMGASRKAIDMLKAKAKKMCG